MGGDGPGIEPGQDGDAAKNGLDDGPEERNRRQREHRAAGIGPLAALTSPPGERTRDGGYGEGREDEGEQTIAELDVLVPLLLLAGSGHQRALGTLGPGGAAQSRSREANDPSRDDDPDLGDQIGDEDAA